MERYRELYAAMLDEHAKVFAAQDVAALDASMQRMAEAARIFVVGAGREGIVARAFAMRLVHLGKEVHWLWDDTSPAMKKGDLFIAVNGSGQIGHIDYLLDRAGETGASRLVITGAPNERTPRDAETCLFVPAMVYKGTDARCVPSVQPMGNLFEQHLFLLFDLLVMLLRERLGESYDGMESRHRNIE